MLKAECETKDCGYTVRVAAKWINDPGPPHCPKHGPMLVTVPADAEGEAEVEPESGEARESV